MEKMQNCKYRFGFTGSLDGTQTNKLVLEGLFGPVRKVTTTAKLIEQKHLSDFNIKAIVLKHSEETRKIMTGADYQQELDFIVRNDARNNFIKNLVLSLEGNTLVLFQFVEKHGKVLFDLVSKEAVDRKVFFISGDVNGEKREEIRRIFATEENIIAIASFGTSSTGINIPSLRNGVSASPSKSRVRNLQSIGRSLRRTESKSQATWYDIADDLSWKSKRNHTLLHFVERVKVYNEEKFPLKIYNIDLK
jgi:superfamily II DNA or RNA helicase